jgi:hypothetical protein
MMGGFPSWSNTHFKKESIVDARQLPERVFLQEYAARFLQDLGAVFRDILSARTGTLDRPREDIEYVAGVDWGRAGSFTVVAILDAHRGHLVAYDRFRRSNWKLQTQRVARLLRDYNAITLTDSSGLGDPVFEMLYGLYDNVRPFKITNPSKADIVENLAIMIESGKITYPDIPELIEELSVFGMEQRSNVIRYKAPKGFHDDFVIALALAAWQIRSRRSDVSFEFLPLL